MTMEEYVNKFLDLLWYIDYIWYTKVKIQRFLSGISHSKRDGIDFVEPKTLDDAIHKAMHCYEQNKNQSEEHHSKKEKSSGKYDQHKKKKIKYSPYKDRPKSDPQGQQIQSEYKRFKPTKGRF